ncbi:MAG TPA: TIM44-like domain-containing protein [Caulobacteraceae bacterium]|jgi:predicted lipid-binding transport protein (Tim44 family)|nr:TIM44-like domain-containing protein [Caulobacteraceae bacterium]
MSVERRRRVLSIAAVGLVLSLALAGSAEARRGGSFGSRGMRTYQAPRSTFTAPQAAAPIQRSMTSPSQAPGVQPGFRQPAPAALQPQRGGFLQRWGGPILGGFLGAGLFGMLMGHGFGGGFGSGGGMLALMLQIGVIALLAMAAMRLFRRGAGSQSAFAGPFAGQSEPFGMAAPQPMFQPAAAPSPNGSGDELSLSQSDFDAFERLLTEVQGAFGREDYAALRERTTPEIMSYLAEELSQNAVAGRRNEVRDVRLVSGDLSEAWSEGAKDYATVAMRYASVDLMRDRTDGHIVSGGETPTETTEIWTFVRERGGPWGATWKLSAIQETA